MATIIDALQHLGMATARQIAAWLDISQPTVSRLIAANAKSIITVGAGRSTRYVLRGALPRMETPVPVYRVSNTGAVNLFGSLEPSTNGRFLFRDELFDDLPWMIWDARPQGFLGRAVARAESLLGLPRSLDDWTSVDILVCLTRRGEDCVGDLIVGAESLNRFLGNAARPASREDYLELAELAVRGEDIGSSAGGEQPKFAVTVDGVARLVKFSPPIADAISRRRGELLICEHIALTVLREHGEPAAASTLIEGERTMLETVRFDRTEQGRRALVSGAAVDAQFVGSGEWSGLTYGLERQALISKSDAERLRLWRTFGALIGNTDMHLGNVSFFTDDYARFSLAPAYDMLPMYFAPTASGEIIQRSMVVSVGVLHSPVFDFAASMAEDFWNRVHERLSGEFRLIAEDALRELTSVRRKMARIA